MITRRSFLLLPVSLGLARGQEGLEAGFVHLYHLRFPQGRTTFRTWQQAHPLDPMGHIAEAASHLFEEFEAQDVLTTEFFLDDDRFLDGIRGKPNASRLQAFENANEQGRALAERQHKKDARDTNALLALTLASGMHADSLSILEKKQVAALREIRAADAHGRMLLKLAPTMGDAYVALGAANYILGSLPAYKRAVLWFGGMQGDRGEGLEQLGRAAREGAYLAPYAKVLLALALIREKRAAEASRWMRELVTAFPDSPLFRREQAKIDRIAGIHA